jgi:DNA-directed RNA polymerase subunit M/transcription elongation factor TFIIS
MICEKCEYELDIDYFKDKKTGNEKIHLQCSNCGYEDEMDLHQSPIWTQEIKDET